MSGSIVTQQFRDLLAAFGVHCTFRESKDYAGVFADVRDGRAKAGVTNRLFGSVHEREYQVVPTTLVFGASRLHFAFPKRHARSRFLADRIDLRVRELKDAPNAVYNEAIHRYLTGTKAEGETGEFVAELLPEGGIFTQLENTWIAGHPSIRIGIDPAYMPYEWFDKQNEVAGVAADFIKMLSDRCGVTMEPVRTHSWAETVRKAQEREIDVIVSMARSAERTAHFLFSKPYLHLPLVVVTRKDYRIVGGMRDLDSSRIAVVTGHLATELLKKRFPEKNLKYFDRLEQTMNAVSRGQADALFQPVSIVKYFEQRMGITNLRVAATSPWSNDICLAVRNDWPICVSIFNKGLDRIGETEKELILNKWLNPRIERHVDWMRVGLWLGLIIAAAMSIIGLMVRANRRLAAQVQERKKVEAALKVARDTLEEQVHARTEELWKANRQLEEAQRIAHVGNWEWDIGKDRFTGSDECYRIFGMPPGELIPGLKTYLGYIYSDDRRLINHAFEKAVKGPDPFDLQHRISHSDGSIRHVHGRGEIVRDDAGRPLKMVGTLQDITAAKQAQEALQQAKDDLEMRVKERTAELAIAKDRAEESDRLKSAFLATMSHELRTPLNSIIGFTGIILQGLVGDVTDEQRKQLGMVRNSAHHLLALINDVLDISKIEAGQLEISREWFSVREAIEKAVGVVKPLADKKELPITATIDPEVKDIYSDRRRFEQICINLLSNAVKFTDTGTISLNARIESPDGGDSGRLTLRIDDTGIGIKQLDHAKLFKPFQQIDTGTTRRYEGTGLGLSICRKLAHLLDGEIDAFSEGPGKGSSFTLTLPLQRS